jgi:hypothetical protein
VDCWSSPRRLPAPLGGARPMSTDTLGGLCQRVRPELACLGELGRPLLDVVAVIERLAGSSAVSRLSEPAFALDVLSAAGISADPAVIGRLLDFLRQRASAAPALPIAGGPPVTITEAVEQYHRGALALLARGSQHTYRTWTRRLITTYGDRPPASISAGDLTDLIAEHVLARRSDDERRRSGRSAEENAVGAYRHLWTYLVEKGYAADNVAHRLRKPARIEPRRRGFLADEAALLRQLARCGQDARTRRGRRTRRDHSPRRRGPFAGCLPDRKPGMNRPHPAPIRAIDRRSGAVRWCPIPAPRELAL